MNCPKCKGEMEEGAIMERGKGTLGVSKWGKGVNRLLGTIEESKEVKTFRCTSCGYLESYAK